MIATTRWLDDAGDLLDWLGTDGFAWLTDELGLVTAGSAWTGDARSAGAALAGIEHDDNVRERGTGPIALGALPFLNTDRGELCIPARIVGRRRDRTWITEIGTTPETPLVTEAPAPPPASALPTDPARVAVRSIVDDVAWKAMVNEALRRIEAHHLDKVVLAREVVVDASEAFDRVTILRRFLMNEPGCFVYAAPGLVGASPELLVRRHGTKVTSRPMAGTVARQSPLGERKAIAELTHSAKQSFEHRVVVEAVASTLEDAGCIDVKLPRGPDVARFATVAHLATTITAAVADAGPSALELALALHPTPAVGGNPRDAALATIKELEPFARGRYAGPVGWVDAHGNGEWAIALRGAELDDRRATVRAGAGIVTGSEPSAEWDEIEAKLATVLRAVLG